VNTLSFISSKEYILRNHLYSIIGFPTRAYSTMGIGIQNIIIESQVTSCYALSRVKCMDSLILLVLFCII